MIELNRYQIERILELFDDGEDEITLARCREGHSGAGLYAYYTGYPEEGSFFIPAVPEEQGEEEACTTSG
jgi:hypothetical protein